MATDTTKTPRNRALLRSYDYDALSGQVKDANTQEVLVGFELANIDTATVQKLALSAAMGLIAGAGLVAHNDGKDAKAAMLEALGELSEGKVEFKGGVGVSLGGTLKRIARALTDLGKVYVMAPDGTKLTWESGDINGAFTAMRDLWAIKEDATRTGEHQRTESGRSMINRIKAIPAVAEKLASYSKEGSAVELG